MKAFISGKLAAYRDIKNIIKEWDPEGKNKYFNVILELIDTLLEHAKTLDDDSEIKENHIIQELNKIDEKIKDSIELDEYLESKKFDA